MMVGFMLLMTLTSISSEVISNRVINLAPSGLKANYLLQEEDVGSMLECSTLCSTKLLCSGINYQPPLCQLTTQDETIGISPGFEHMTFQHYKVKQIHYSNFIADGNWLKIRFPMPMTSSSILRVAGRFTDFNETIMHVSANDLLFPDPDRHDAGMEFKGNGFCQTFEFMHSYSHITRICAEAVANTDFVFTIRFLGHIPEMMQIR